MEIDLKEIIKNDNLSKEELIKVAEMQLNVLENLRFEAYKNNYWAFVSEVMPYKDLYEPLHKRVCDFVQHWLPTHNVLLLLPRGSFKSSVVTVGYSMWKIAQDVNTRGMIGNATYPMATSFVKQVQSNLERNEDFIKYFGDLHTDAPVWRENALTVKGASGLASKENTLVAYGLTSNVTGAHFDWAILDDLVNDTNIKSKEGLEKPKEFYRNTLNLVDPDKNGRRPIIIIGTTWHQGDLYSWLMDKSNPASKEFKVLRIPAYEGEWGKGNLAFPTRLTWKALEKQRNQQGLSHFASQYLLDPVPPDNATFRKFTYYEEEDIRGLKLNKFIAVDPAISEKDSGDFSAMVCVGVDANNSWYVLDLWRDKVKPSRLIDQIFYWDTKWQPITTAFESVVFQKAVRYQLDVEMRKRNQFIPIKEFTSRDKTKRERIMGLEPLYETEVLHHLKSHPLNEDLEMELTRFPSGLHDDLIDALATIKEIAFPPKKKEFRNKHRGFSGGYPA